MQPIVPVIMCGGAGRRLWPWSTPEQPKPFLGFGSSESLFQQALLRVSGPLFGPRPIVVADQRHAGIVNEQALAVGMAVTLVLEPAGRDTCAAALAGLLVAGKRGPHTCAALFAADHSIPDRHAFEGTLAQAVPAAEKGFLVTFGIRPRSPSPELGYLVPGADTGLVNSCHVQSFSEKPDVAKAAGLIGQGARWNSGNFMGCVETWLAEAVRHAPQVLSAVKASLPQFEAASEAIVLSERFLEAPAISLDRAVMERSEQVVMAAADYAWSDLGTWDEVARHMGKPEGPFVLSENAEVILSGFDDVIVVSRDGRILVTRRGQSADLKDRQASQPVP